MYFRKTGREAEKQQQGLVHGITLHLIPKFMFRVLCNDFGSNYFVLCTFQCLNCVLLLYLGAHEVHVCHWLLLYSVDGHV